MAELPAGQQDAVAERYPALGPVTRVLWSRRLENSVAALFETATGQYFLKGTLASERPSEALAGEHRLIAHLVARGFPTPEVLRAPGGETFFAHGDRLWAVYRAAAGEDRYHDAPVFAPFGSVAEARSAGEALARFHLALRDYPDPPVKPLQGLVARYELAATSDVRGAIAEWLAPRPGVLAFLEKLPAYGAAIERFRALASGLELGALPRGVIHGDWIKRNLFFEGDEVTAVVDFELCNSGPLVFDLALAVSAAAYPWEPLLRGEAPRTEHADAMRQGYEALRPLSAAERRAWPGLLATCRFDFYVALVAATVERGDRQRARWLWEGLTGLLGWWRGRLGK